MELQLWKAMTDDLPRSKHLEYVVDVDPINLR